MVLRLRLTNNCNLSCHYCFLKDALNSPEEDHLSVDEWKKVLSFLPRTMIVDIAGNEPFLAKNFEDILTLLLDKRCKVSLITNGMMIDEQLIRKMIKKKLSYLMVSLDGLQMTHNRLRGNGDSFANAVTFIKKVNQLKKEMGSSKPIICVKTALTEDGAEDLVRLQDFIFDELQVDQHTINLLFQNKGRGGNRLVTDVDDLTKLPGNTQVFSKVALAPLKWTLAKLTGRKNVNVKPPMKPSNWEYYLEKPSDFGVKNCMRPYSVLTMYFDGRITPCDLALNLGNIRDFNYNLRKVWKSPQFFSFWKKYHDAGRQMAACEGCNMALQTRKTSSLH